MVSAQHASWKLEELTRSDFWFSDGNIVLVAHHAAFKVHRGQLERHSDMFKDLFSIPQPQHQDTIDGCPWVELHDSPSDVLHLLGALYDGLYFTNCAARNFAALAGVLRLSTKYLIEHLRLRCLARLHAEWPSTLLDWDVRERQATDAAGRYTPRDHFTHPILVIRLARELDLDELLPSAMYDLSRYGPRKIVSGTIVHPPALPSSAPHHNSPDVDGDGSERICLARDDLHTIFLGREAGQRYLASFIDKELSNRQVSANCAHKSQDNARACRESFYFIMLNLLRSVGGIACGRDADPLFTFMQAVAMLSRTDFSDGVKQCGLKLCASCKTDFGQSVAKAREDVWSLIPQWFGLTTSPHPADL
ncbi:uncharacterized protein LAESUDRAFT_667425 [Laetiporus sulphureus 93-53]|uniref:BTB domain-containing protein n=1 Tax=Laetiporus sulphureus 93-53 TaxID=1314785 RepID=A0A165AY48_9APHY|nr:uncharacterized protein LAESUDRAFT_667425 [Laetiporus sulphureus 93-53]KZS99877.1 hypothetical protein LAESUDRAFT_667425 [Laetiporus sulphureus 93-53]